MLTLYHHPFCPHSRFIRLAIGEYGLDLQLVEERAWERREAFLVLNPAGTTPVLTTEGLPAVPGAGGISEFLDEAYGPDMGERRLLLHPTGQSRADDIKQNIPAGYFGAPHDIGHARTSGDRRRQAERRRAARAN
jgi:glutathione S-transferase